jgi:glutamyl/glutaminyl-tRNA synthetase
VVDIDGKRLAKRRDDLGLTELRARGASPERIVAFVARSSGLQAPEAVSARELVAEFDVRRVPKARVTLDPRSIEAFLAR